MLRPNFFCIPPASPRLSKHKGFPTHNVNRTPKTLKKPHAHPDRPPRARGRPTRACAHPAAAPTRRKPRWRTK
eukprot:4137526-Prymnesium_polylepis.1